jgi:hypothetical protein
VLASVVPFSGDMPGINVDVMLGPSAHNDKSPDGPLHLVSDPKSTSLFPFEFESIWYELLDCYYQLVEMHV